MGHRSNILNKLSYVTKPKPRDFPSGVLITRQSVKLPKREQNFFKVSSVVLKDKQSNFSIRLLRSKHSNITDNSSRRGKAFGFGPMS